MRIFLNTLIFVSVGFFSLPLQAQEVSSVQEIGYDPFPKCQQTDADNTTKDILYKKCFSPPNDQFYGQALIDFSIENTDFNGLLEDGEKSTKKNFLKILKDLFVEDTDIAHFILLAKAKDVSGTEISLGATRLFSIRKVGKKNYAISDEIRYGPLPVRFLAQPSTTVEFKLTAVTERQVDSKIAELLVKASKFSGISLPSIAGIDLTNLQNKFVEVDEELSKALSSQVIISRFTPLYFKPEFAQSYESKFVLRRYMPDGAGLKLRIATNFETSIFPQIKRDVRSTEEGLIERSSAVAAEPGGLLADQFKNTPFLGQQLTNHVLKNIDLKDYRLLRQATDEKEFLDACWKLETYLQNGPLALTSGDKLRISWAHLSGNALLKKQAVRDKYCLATKEDALRNLGLGLPEIEGTPLPDKYFVILDRARIEAEAATRIKLDAISKRDAAVFASETAFKASDYENYRVENLGFFSFAGQALVEGEQSLGMAHDLVSNRKGNTYTGEIVRIGDRIVLQGLGQYQSKQPSDGLGFKTFTGRFEGDLGSGNAEVVFHSGVRFLGQVSREKPHGFGVWKEIDGTNYYLEMVEGERTGSAIKEDVEGNRTAGEFITHNTFRPIDQ